MNDWVSMLVRSEDYKDNPQQRNTNPCKRCEVGDFAQKKDAQEDTTCHFLRGDEIDEGGAGLAEGGIVQRVAQGEGQQAEC